MSYVRFDDKHDDGQVSVLRKQLEHEVRVQTGEEFRIFQDRVDIALGQNWRQRIEETLDTVMVLLVIVTPALFRSKPCREEITRFRKREKRLGREDLILPVYYISAPVMDDPALRGKDEIAGLLWSRQYADWRDLRFESITSPAVRKATAQLATRVTAVCAPSPTPRKAGIRRWIQRQRLTIASASDGQAEGTRGHDTKRTEPPVKVVDARSRSGAFSTVNTAIKAANPGDKILVRPGRYDEESLLIDKPLQIIGDGQRGDIEIRVRNAQMLEFRASAASAENLVLRHLGEESWPAVLINTGRVELVNCDISSETNTGISIWDHAEIHLRRNKIHNCRLQGVYIHGSEQVTLEGNDIFDNGTGVIITDSANAMLRRNRIYDNDGYGVSCQRGGSGTLNDNDIFGNKFSGIEIEATTRLTLRGNRVNRNKDSGIRIQMGGKCVAEDNDLTGNVKGAWLNPLLASDPDVRRARNKE